MRLIDLILRTWGFRQTLQDAYERGLPQTQVNTDYLETVGEAKRRDRVADRPAHLSQMSKTAEAMLRDYVAPDKEPYTVEADQIDLSKAFGDVKQSGFSGLSRDHKGIILWEWLVGRLKEAEIVLPIDDDFAAIDRGFCQPVAELAAEMFLMRRDGDCTVPLREPWVIDIEKRVDNEFLSDAILDLMYNVFGFNVATDESTQLAVESQLANKPQDVAELLSRPVQAEEARQ